MKSLVVLLLAFFCSSLLLFGHTGAAARKLDAAEYRRATVMKDQRPLPVPDTLEKNDDCHDQKQPEKALEPEKKMMITKEDEKVVEDFEPRLNLSAYGDDDDEKKMIIAEEDEKVIKDFEPRLNLSAYGDDDDDDKKRMMVN